MNMKKMSDAKLATAIKKMTADLKKMTAEADRRKKEGNAQAKAQKELAALAKKYGAATIKKLAATTKGKGRGRPAAKRAKVKPVYRNPDNSSETWTGRGRSPKWVVAAEKKYGGREKLKIANQ